MDGYDAYLLKFEALTVLGHWVHNSPRKGENVFFITPHLLRITWVNASGYHEADVNADTIHIVDRSHANCMGGHDGCE